MTLIRAFSGAERAWIAVAGVLLVVGGITHPNLPRGYADLAAITGSALWLASHWMLTAGQGIAMLVLGTRSAPEAGRPLRVAAVGMGFGTLGTLFAATVIPLAARDHATYPTWNAFVMAIGWTAIPITGVAGVMLGRMLRARQPIMGWVLLLGGAGAILATLVPPTSWWTHQVVLRAGAVGVGLIFLAWSLRRQAPA